LGYSKNYIPDLRGLNISYSQKSSKHSFVISIFGK